MVGKNQDQNRHAPGCAVSVSVSAKMGSADADGAPRRMSTDSGESVVSFASVLSNEEVEADENLLRTEEQPLR